jgi:uncharacterized protein (DUF302 family)
MNLRVLLAVPLLGIGLSAVAAENDAAGKIYRAQINQPFADAVNSLQFAIQDAGYKVLRIQRVDFGLRASGYQSEPYRIVFYGRRDVADTIERRPDLAVFLPLAITVYADRNKTHITAASPLTFAKDTDTGVLNNAAEWDRDLRKIFKQLLSEEAE